MEEDGRKTNQSDEAAERSARNAAPSTHRADAEVQAGKMTRRAKSQNNNARPTIYHPSGKEKPNRSETPRSSDRLGSSASGDETSPRPTDRRCANLVRNNRNIISGNRTRQSGTTRPNYGNIEKKPILLAQDEKERTGTRATRETENSKKRRSAEQATPSAGKRAGGTGRNSSKTIAGTRKEEESTRKTPPRPRSGEAETAERTGTGERPAMESTVTN